MCGHGQPSLGCGQEVNRILASEPRLGERRQYTIPPVALAGGVYPWRSLDPEDSTCHFRGGVMSSTCAGELVHPLKGAGSLNGWLVPVSWMWLQRTAWTPQEGRG